jgi:hypothetical protein
MGERRLCTAEARGSNPLISTELLSTKASEFGFDYRELNHLILKALSHREVSW